MGNPDLSPENPFSGNPFGKSYSDHLIIGQLSPLKMKIFRPCPNFQSFHLLSDSGDIEKHAV